MSILVIVESPAKCKKIEQYLGSSYKCMASYGHFRNCKSLKNIDYNSKFAITFEPMEEKKLQIEKLRTAINKSKEVIIATDDDREGEAIGWHILDHFKLPLKTKRIIFHEITESALKQSIQNPTIVNMNKVYSQQARQVLDLMVGFTISPLLWKYISRTQGLSAGRCQTPALNLVYENHIENQQKELKMSYKTIGYFMSKNFEYELNKELLTKKSVLEFLELSKTFVHLYNKKNPVKFVTAPPLPLHTSSIQQLINTQYHYSPKDIMQSCQVLYEKGYITYMRTDNKCYSKEFIQSAQKFITDNYGDIFNSASISNITIQENSSEAHEAIRPTNILMNTCKDSSCSKRDTNIYQFIYNHTLKSCMADAYGKKLKTTISAPLNYEYSHTEKIYEFLGWKIVDGESEESYYNYFKQLKNDMEVTYNKIHSKVQHKNVGSHLSEANLVQLLEKKGIGRPSTFSSLVEKIQTRGYVKKVNIAAKKVKTKEYTLENKSINELDQIKEVGGEKKRLVIQSIGLLICEWLYKNHDSLFNYEYTSKMEEKLDLISKNNLTYYDICKEIHEYLSNIESDSKKMEKQIDDNHTLIYAKNGFVVKTKEQNKTVFKTVKPNIDFQNVENFSLEEILDDSNEKNVGTFRDIDIIIKKGKFGPYFNFENKNYSLSSISKTFEQINIADVIDIIQNYNSNEQQSNNIKQLDDNLSIRNGKFGHYLYYKTIKMKKPSFTSLQKCGFDYENTDDVSLFYKYIELSKSKSKNKKKY